jgi:hypothetical protein
MTAQENPPIAALLVAEANRLRFLPTYFGPRWMMRGDRLVYAWMRQLCEQYGGAYWHYYELPDGGFYMAPDLAHGLCIEVPGNGFSGNLSADAAGVVATLFALGQLANEIAVIDEDADTNEADALIDRFHLLRDFAVSHPEASMIFQALD